MKTIPELGVGTFRLEGDVAEKSVKMALELGFRHIDTAQIYENEAEVGKAIEASGVPRADIFLTTKVWLENLGQGRFLDSVHESLKKLRTEYVDLLLIHWPAGDGGPTMSEYLLQLAAARDSGLAKAIGVSNFTMAQLDQARGILGDGTIATNQIEVHPYFQNRQVADYCRARGVRVTGYMPLAYGKVLEDKTLKTIAERHGVGVGEVVLAWSLASDVITIPSSTSRTHLQSNLSARKLKLSVEELQTIAELDRGERLVDPDFAPMWDD